MAWKSQIYTGGGDKGQTSLIGGQRVPKYHLRIEAYGTVDELLAHTSLLRDQIEDEAIRKELLHILELLMASSAVLACGQEDSSMALPHLKEEDVCFLEERIDAMDASLPRLSSFILPGGHPVVSQAHVARTVCRRAERIILHLNDSHPLAAETLRFHNRLSDYFFMLSRLLSVRFGCEQSPWKSSL